MYYLFNFGVLLSKKFDCFYRFVVQLRFIKLMKLKSLLIIMTNYNNNTIQTLKNTFCALFCFRQSASRIFVLVLALNFNHYFTDQIHIIARAVSGCDAYN